MSDFVFEVDHGAKPIRYVFKRIESALRRQRNHQAMCFVPSCGLRILERDPSDGTERQCFGCDECGRVSGDAGIAADGQRVLCSMCMRIDGLVALGKGKP